MKDIIYFIDEQTLKDNSPLDDNVDTKQVHIAMRSAQEIEIQTALGSDLYKDMQDALADDPTYMEHTAYKTLLDDYIQQAMIWLTIKNIVTWLTFKLQNKNIAKKDSENSTPIEREDLSFIRSEAKSKGEWYLERMKKFICEHEADYPLYFNSSGDLDRIAPDKHPFKSSMFLDRETIIKGIPTYKEPYK